MTRTADASLTAIDALLARPFPETASRDGMSGPEHLIEVLRTSRDFWDDPFHEAATAAYAEFEAALDALATTLTARWGVPTTVDLWSYLRAGPEGCQAPEPVAHLSNCATSMQAWTPPGSSRWLGLTIGQWDTELPMELLAAVGAGAVPVGR